MPHKDVPLIYVLGGSWTPSYVCGTRGASALLASAHNSPGARGPPHQEGPEGSGTECALDTRQLSISPKLETLHRTGRSHDVSGSVTPTTLSTSSPDPGEAKAEMRCTEVRRQVTGLWTQALDATRIRHRRAGSHSTFVKRDGHSRAFLSHVHSHREYEVKQRHIRVLGKDSKHRGPLSECPADKTRKSVRTVSFIWIWLIFIRNNLCLNSPLNVNVSPSSTSFPLGLLTRTRALPHARDCSVLRSSLSSEWGENQAAATIKVSETRQE